MQEQDRNLGLVSGERVINSVFTVRFVYATNESPFVWLFSVRVCGSVCVRGLAHYACVLMHETVKSDHLFKLNSGTSRSLHFMHTFTLTHIHIWKVETGAVLCFVLKPVLTAHVSMLVWVHVCVCGYISNANLLRTDFGCCVFLVVAAFWLHLPALAYL